MPVIISFANDLTIEVKVVGNAIKCGTNGGDLKVKPKKADGTPLKVKWTNVDNPQQQFQLQFRARWEEQGDNFWPFTESMPTNGLTEPGVNHTFTFADENNECKYSVIIGSLVLDPIIIVEK